MSGQNHPRTLQRKLFFSFLGLTILLSISISICSYIITYRVLRERISSSYSFTLDYIVNSVKIETSRIEYLTNFIFVNKTIKQAIEHKDENSYESVDLNYQAYFNLKNYFIAHNLSDINSVSVLGSNGYHLFYYSNLDEQELQVIPEIRQESSRMLQESSGGIIWSGLKEKTYGTGLVRDHEVRIYRTIKDESFTRDIGFMLVSVKPHLFSKLIQIYDSSFPQFARNTGIYITHKDTILADSGTLDILPEKVLASLEDPKAYTLSGYKIKDSNYISFVKDIEGTSWKVVGIIPRSLIHVDNAHIFWISLIAFLLCIIVCALLWLYFSSTVFKPLQQLSRTIRRIEKGESSLRADVSEEDEIGILSANFNSMLDTNEVLYEKNLQKEMDLKEAQYQRLQAQINPHFLYNTLNSIRWMAIMCKADNIKLAIDAFWAISRYNFKTDEKFTTIAQEIEIIEKYLYLQGIAYKDAFLVEWEVDQELLDYRCIKFFLQPIVENAVKHGILQSGRMGMIRILVAKVDRSIEFSVYDSGDGIPSEVVSMLISGKQVRSGLANVFYRLELAYADTYTIEFISDPGCSTTVIIRIPMEPYKTC